jgi:hypothetical protein
MHQPSALEASDVRIGLSRKGHSSGTIFWADLIEELNRYGFAIVPNNAAVAVERMPRDPRGLDPRSVSYDRAAVEPLVRDMYAKLRKNADKGGWDTLEAPFLLRRAIEEVAIELRGALTVDGSPDDIRNECADGANFLAMIHSQADRFAASRVAKSTILSALGSVFE